MPNTQEADKRLVAWLKERTDRQLERIMEAPDDGLTNVVWVGGPSLKCLAGWAFGWSKEFVLDEGNITEEHDRGATGILADLNAATGGTHTETFRRIKAYVAAELLTRRVNRKRLPAPQASGGVRAGG